MSRQTAVNRRMGEHSSKDIPSTKQVFVPQETSSNPYDVSLVVEDGRREFKAHRRVLSEASPFFEKLFNSDMRESNQGVVRLEMLTELCLGKILEFIYTGNVQISTEDEAHEIITAADYLVLPRLKALAGRVLAQNLDSSKAMLTYQFAERFRCEELIFATKMLIYSNFTTLAKTEEFLNLSSEEVQMWISSDEINVSAEEDVFKIILTWINLAKSERKKHFPELFREVRLVYVSRDFLQNDIVTNDLVNDNEGCMDLVKDAMKLTDSEIVHFYSTKPRKSLETSVIVFYQSDRWSENNKRVLVCYFPQEEKWSTFTLPPGPLKDDRGVAFACRDKLYFFGEHTSLLVYDSFSNCWKACALPTKDRLVFVKNEEEMYSMSTGWCNRCLDKLQLGDWHADSIYCEQRRHCDVTEMYKLESNSWDRVALLVDRAAVWNDVWKGSKWSDLYRKQLFVKNEEIYALSDGLCMGCLVKMHLPDRDCRNRHISFIERYKPESDSLEHVALFDMGPTIRESICIVAKDNYIYFLGGRPIYQEFRNLEDLADCDRYDLSTNTWDKIADLQKPRAGASGAAAYGKIFVFGGCHDSSCEVYDETTNEWHFIASLKSPVVFNSTVVCVDDEVFLVSVYKYQQDEPGIIECYDPHEDEWKEKSRIPLEWTPLLRLPGLLGCNSYPAYGGQCHSMRVFKGSKLSQSEFLQTDEDQGRKALLTKTLQGPNRQSKSCWI